MKTRASFLRCFSSIIIDFFVFLIILVWFLMIFRDFHQKCAKNDPKINLGTTDPVQMEENCDHHRISHGLKPNVVWSFCFWRCFWLWKLWVKGGKKEPQEDPKKIARRNPPWEEVGGECFAPHSSGRKRAPRFSSSKAPPETKASHSQGFQTMRNPMVITIFFHLHGIHCAETNFGVIFGTFLT